MSDNLWRHPTTKRYLPIANTQADGGFRTSKALMSFLKKGRYDLIEGSDYLYNKETGRVVDKSVYFNRSGKMRPKFIKEGWAMSDDHKTVIEKPVAFDFEKTFKEKPLANSKYVEGAFAYKRPKTTQQDRISRNVDAKIALMKEDGRIEIDGSPSDMIEALKQLGSKPHVSYVTKAGLYRAGGFLRKVNEDGEWIVIAQPSMRLSFSVDLKEVQALYAQAFKYVIPPLVESTETPTKFPVTVNGIIVKYCKDNYKRNRHMSTDLFKAIVAHYKD